MFLVAWRTRRVDSGGMLHHKPGNENTRRAPGGPCNRDSGVKILEVLINGVTGEVEASTQVTGYRTNQALKDESPRSSPRHRR